MPTAIEDQVIDYYYALFERIFSDPFSALITERLRRDAVLRQVQESAAAASQSLTRFFRNEQLTTQQVAAILTGFGKLADLLKLADIANPNVTPESVVENLLPRIPCPPKLKKEAAVYRVALHSLVQVLMLVGPVMAEWRRLNFSSTFELPRRVVSRLNQISEQMAALGRAGPTAADERFELTYRDHLLQRFHRVEAGTVRMTTNLDVDLRELFVMPRVLERPRVKTDDGTLDLAALMNLAAARKFFGVATVARDKGDDKKAQEAERGVPAVEQIKRSPRNVVVGAPGGGKSTFLEWLQLMLGSVELEHVMGGEQALPLLLRMRQLDAKRLPRNAELIARAMLSRDRAALMPDGWVERQMRAGRVLFMFDGLDETDPKLRDRYVIPWLTELCAEYKDCQFLISSRPVGYEPGALSKLDFAECDLLDFAEPEVAAYTRHWCVAVRLARNEPADEARREGASEGEQIVKGFIEHPYIRDLARNPLMLSAICLVNYFEGGQLPKDRAMLYKLCVEGLLHHWDQRRGINSEYSLEEKLRACREVAIAMQHDDRAEYEADKVRRVFAKVLGSASKAKKLLEHIRYRTGLLIERRPSVFAFAHLTFQEYLAALAVHEGNLRNINAAQLAREHADGRWHKVIALYCGLTPAPAARGMIEQLIAQPDSQNLSSVLTEAYLSIGAALARDTRLRSRVLERIAIAPFSRVESALQRFPPQEVNPVANRNVGTLTSNLGLSEAFSWLRDNRDFVDFEVIIERLRGWRKMSPLQIDELFYLAHLYAAPVLLQRLNDDELYASVGSTLVYGSKYNSQAEIALEALGERNSREKWQPDLDPILMRIMRVLPETLTGDAFATFFLAHVIKWRRSSPPPKDITMRAEFHSLARALVARATHEISAERTGEILRTEVKRGIIELKAWIKELKGESGTRSKQAEAKGKTKTRSKGSVKGLTKRRQKI
ncbi:MAG: NACHT domain-containing protein [Pyrinomonadaceae bacterium]